jgi:hypothetical protein
MACEEIGQFHGEPEDFVSFVLSIDANGECQRVQVGANSPGHIHDDETLARFVFAPAHLGRETGEINESLVLDAFKFGASVNRVLARRADTLAVLHQLGETQAEDIRRGSPPLRAPQPLRQYLGFVQFTAREVRGVSIDAVPARLRLYDTAKPNNAHHGDIVGDATDLSKKQKKELRVRLFNLMKGGGLFLSPILEANKDVSQLGIAINLPTD